MGRTRHSSEELARNFAEIHPPLNRDEARAQAARCLFCYDAPCTRACPTGIDVPRFIRQILHGNTSGAAETILDSNVLGGSCARVCPTEVLCEGACVARPLQGTPVPIGLLQRHAVDHAVGHGQRFFDAGPDTGKRVAVVGAGPAGLSCAFELRRRGHAVTIFEAREVPGGLNTFGIAAYKISRAVSLDEVERVREMGVEIRLGTRVDGSGLTRLLEENDAVFLGMGLGPTAALGIPGEEAEGVVEALDFIFQTREKPLEECRVGQDVVVIGGGNTAIDAAIAAARLGAGSVRLVYRRTQEEMPAYRHEYERAKADGVGFEWQARPTAIRAEDGRVQSVTFRRVRQEGEGRHARLVDLDDSIDVECDMVIKALGQAPLLDLLGGLEGVRVEGSRILVAGESGATAVPGLYAGGDCVNGGAEVVDAVQAGKLAAHAISEHVSAGG